MSIPIVNDPNFPDEVYELLLNRNRYAVMLQSYKSSVLQKLHMPNQLFLYYSNSGKTSLFAKLTCMNKNNT